MTVAYGMSALPLIGGGRIRSSASFPKKTQIKTNAAGCRNAAFVNAQTHIKPVAKTHENHIVWCYNLDYNTRRVDSFFKLVTIGEAMFKLIAVVMTVALFGCTGLQVGDSIPCTIYEDFGANPENSIIAKHIANPCAAQRLLATAAKLPAVWADKKYIDKFNQWSGVVHNAIAKGITYQALQDMVVLEIAKLNKEAGMTLLILGDGLLVFGDVQSPISPVDQKLLLASLNDLRVQVARLSLMGM